jgi:hypothetical protein
MAFLSPFVPPGIHDEKQEYDEAESQQNDNSGLVVP